MDERQLVKECLSETTRLHNGSCMQLFDKSMLGVCYRYTKWLEERGRCITGWFCKSVPESSPVQIGERIRRMDKKDDVTASLNYLKRNRRYRAELSFETRSYTR